MNKRYIRMFWPVALLLVFGLVLAAGAPALAGVQNTIEINFYEPQTADAPQYKIGSGAGAGGETVDDFDPDAAFTSVASPLTDWEVPEVVLYDNGPLVNSPGTGVGGADESVLQTTSLSMNTLGFGHQMPLGYWITDDFTVTDAEGWTVFSMMFFAYQTGSSTTSTMTDVGWLVYDGDPSAGGSVIASGSGIDSTIWTNIYRVTETSTGVATDRPIMAQTVDAGGLFLPQGTYWLAWQTNGTLGSGPWAPPITITGQATTGNGMQSLDNGATWAAANDSGSGTQQGLPFIIEGVVGPIAGAAILLDKTVSTTVGTCPGLDSVTVAPGTQVSYCYEVTNIGTVTLTLHDLVDSELGTLFSGFSYALGPGQSTGAGTGGVTIDVTTVNTATWTAYNPGPIDLATATDTATVTVIPSRCPVGSEEVVVLTESFEGGFPPAGWALANSSTGCTGIPDWTNTDPGARGNLTGGSGLFAIADSDECGSSSVMNAQMWTPSMDLTWLFDPQVSYYTDYNDISSTSDIADLDFSTDGGSTWTNILSWNEDHRGPLLVEEMFPAAGNQSDVRLRWNYINATWDWWWEVDEVVVTACTGTVYMPITAHDQ